MIIRIILSTTETLWLNSKNRFAPIAVINPESFFFKAMIVIKLFSRFFQQLDMENLSWRTCPLFKHNWISKNPQMSGMQNFHDFLVFRSSDQRRSIKKGVLRNFTKFTGRHWRRCFPVNFAKFLRTTFLQNTSGRLLLCLVKARIYVKFLNFARLHLQSHMFKALKFY